MALINAKKVKKLYTCSQAELYSGLLLAWESMKKYEAEFSAENSKYFAGIGDVKKAEIVNAMAMGDLQARGAEGEDMRLRLRELDDELLSRWKSLRSYIKRSFKGAHFKPRIEESGEQYYAKAYNHNWEYVDELAERGRVFIAKHGAVLVSEGGMPVGFAAAFGALHDEFKVLYEKYMSRRQKVPELTQEKIMANNVIYEEGRAMMEDGKHIFRKSAAVRQRFVWKHILKMMGEGMGRKETI